MLDAFQPNDDATATFRAHLAWAGELRYRYQFAPSWGVITGFGWGGTTFRYDFQMNRTFTAGDWLRGGRVEFPTSHFFCSLGISYYRPLTNRLDWGADLVWQPGYFKARNDQTDFFRVEAQPQGFLPESQLRYRQPVKSDFFHSFLFSPGLRWLARPHLRITAQVAALWSGARVLEDSRYLLLGASQIYYGDFELPYRWLGLQLEVAYCW